MVKNTSCPNKLTCWGGHGITPINAKFVQYSWEGHLAELPLQNP